MKVGTGLAGAMIGQVLAFGEYDATLATQSAGVITAIKVLYIYIPLGLYIIDTFVLLFTNLDKIYPIIKRDLEERKIIQLQINILI